MPQDTDLETEVEDDVESGEDSSTEGSNDESTFVSDFDKWLSSQPDETKGLIDRQIKGLKNALSSERESRKSLSRQIRDLKSKAKSGEDVSKELEKVSTQLDEAAHTIKFYESAPRDLNNAKLALVAAKTDGLIDSDGNVDWKRLKKDYPQLFRQTVPPGNAGVGSSSTGAERSMNSFIRASAGRKPT